MALTNSVVCSIEVPMLVDAPIPIDVPVTRKVVVGGSVGAKAVANVEGIAVETARITV